MSEQVRGQHLNTRCALLVVIVCLLVPSEEKLHGSVSLKLGGQGYSPATKTLLVAKIETDRHGKGSWLATYDEVSGSVQRVAIPEDCVPIDFAWIPGRAAFVVADLEKVILFQKDNSGDGYTPTSIQCPSGIWALECSWNPKGEWLAVTCLDEANAMRGALGLYKYGDKALAKTGLALDHRPVTWGNDGLLYGTKDNEVLAIKVTGGKPRVVRTIPLREQLTLFYGIFGEQPLFQAERAVKLGDKRLMMLDQPYKFRVMATGKTIFVSASSTSLGVFDTAGHEIAEGNPGRLIKLGSVKDPNTVYGLADSSLVCLSVEKGALKIQTVADLSRLTGIGPDG
jgi:hypothetical protein